MGITISHTGIGQNKFPTYSWPVRIPVSLSGGYAELRNNHFHGGLDIRTNGRQGIPIYAPADGYISKISVSPYNYGRMICITHPEGFKTIYAHLSEFSNEIEKLVEAEQKKKENFEVELNLSPDQLPIKRGELFAYSGNTGASGAPHLHYEIRDDKNFEWNPSYFGYLVEDITPPRINSIYLYPVSENSLVEGRNQKKRIEVNYIHGQSQLKGKQLITVNGPVGIGVQAVDHIQGSHFTFGVYSLMVTVDDKLIYELKLDRIQFDNTRELNSHIDYEENLKTGRKVHKCFIDPGNDLDLYPVLVNSGIITYKDSGVHQIRIIAKDFSDNKAELEFKLRFNPSASEKKEPEDALIMHYNKKEKIETNDLEAIFSKGTFYQNTPFEYKTEPGHGYFSLIHDLHNFYTPVKMPYVLKIKPVNLPERLYDKAVIVRFSPHGTRIPLASENKDGWIEAEPRDLGKFAVTVDTIAPHVVPINIKNGRLTSSDFIRLGVHDGLTGIKDYKVTIDGQWTLFEYDPRIGQIFHKIRPDSLIHGKTHRMIVTVSDKKNNTTHLQEDFFF
ncbi:MAG: M23 family metallopeptidase [Bacteroidota bacterium]|nr:M23 family metallopeptidase [Bacteroidota bacterium]